jgi:ABC-2 type transport system permease protein
MLYVAVAARSFRRYSTYTAATLAGVFTNSVFGAIIAFTYLALWHENPTAGGYDATDAVTYAWLAQALIMPVGIWGAGTTDEVAERVRTGDVAVDLYRPVSPLGWWLAGDLGRAAYHLLSAAPRRPSWAPCCSGSASRRARWRGWSSSPPWRSRCS